MDATNFRSNQGRPVNPQPTEVKRNRIIGSLWTRSSKKDNSHFFSGVLTLTPELLEEIAQALPNKYGEKEISVVVFSNEKHKKTESSPDYRIYLERKREEQF